MDQTHRNVILQNIHELVCIQNFQEFCRKVVELEVYSPSLIGEVVGDSLDSVDFGLKKKSVQKLFLDFPSRGPEAFKGLVEALQTSENQDLAVKLLNDSFNKSFNNVSLVKAKASNNSLRRRLGRRRNRSGNGSIQHVEDEVDSSQSQSEDIIEIVLEKAVSKVTKNSPEKELLKHKPVDLVPAENLYNGLLDISQCYKMTSCPRGIALIINNIDFPGQSDFRKRVGAEVDGNNLYRVLTEMKFDVVVETNVTKMSLLDRDNGILSNFISRFSSASSLIDSCLVAFNSHGFSKDWIEMCDYPRGDPKLTSVSFYKDIMPRFNNRQFPAFQGKPKIFLINACRGQKSNVAVPFRNKTSLENERKTQHDGNSGMIAHSDLGSEYSDILILRSTIPQYVSLRDPEKGTWFYQCVTEALTKFSHSEDFIGLKRKINSLMEERIDEVSKDKQSCHYEEVGSTKILYFNPGL